MLPRLLVPLLVACATVAVALEISSPAKPPPPPSAPILPTSFRGRVAFACRRSNKTRPAMVWTTVGKWRPETSETRCLTDPDEIRDFCRRVYPGVQIDNVEPAVELEPFLSWCPDGETAPHRCPILNVRPYECLSGPYQSPSLLVSGVCKFMHNSSESPDKPASCHRPAYWEGVAKRSCLATDDRKSMARFGLLLPCNFMPHAGYFAGVEFVCCPEVRIEAGPPEPEMPPRKSASDSSPGFPPLSPSDVEDSDAADADDARYQRYLAVATESGVSEHQRFTDARSGLRHHQARREGAMVRELSEAEARILRLSPRDPESARRLLDEVEKQFRRSFLSVQREEEAEHDQLDSVHQQRIGLLFVSKLGRIKRLLSQSVADGNARDSGRYFARLAGLIAREVVRLANRAGRLTGRLTLSHLTTLRQHAADLLADLKDSSADSGLRRVAGLDTISETLERHEAVLKKANAELTSAKADPANAAAYPPKLAERFDNLLRLYHNQSVRILRQHKLLPPQPLMVIKKRPLQPTPPAPRSNQHSHRMEDDETKMPYDEINVHASQELPVEHYQSALKTSPLFIGLFSGLAIVMTIVAVFITVRICRLLHNSSGGGKGYKLSLVDDDFSSADMRCGGGVGGGGVGAADGCCLGEDGAKAPYSYPTVKPEKAGLGDPHLANMQMNGYENPTYKFYEEK